MKNDQIIDGVNEKAMFDSVQGVLGLDDNEVLENVVETEVRENVVETEVRENVVETEVRENVVETEVPENVVETEVPENVVENEIIADVNKQAMQESLKEIKEDDLNIDDLPEEIEQASDREPLEINEEQADDEDVYDDISDSAKKAYKKLSDDSEGVGIVRKARAFVQAECEYLNENRAEKAKVLQGQNLQETGKYEMPLNEKGLKALKKSAEQAKKTMQLFDKTHEIIKKYAIWAVFVCLLLPFAIPAALAVVAIVGMETVVHETLAQHTYRRVVKSLENNGRNKYKHMYYAKGYKEIDKLVAPEVQAKDIAKLIADMNSPDKEVAKKASEDMKKLVDKNNAAVQSAPNEQNAQNEQPAPAEQNAQNEQPAPTEQTSASEQIASTEQNVTVGQESISTAENNTENLQAEKQVFEEINEKDIESRKMKNEKVKPIEIKDNDVKLVVANLASQNSSKDGEDKANYGIFAKEKGIRLADMAENKNKVNDDKMNNNLLLPAAAIAQLTESKTTQNENKVSVDNENNTVIPVEKSLVVSDRATTVVEKKKIAQTEDRSK